MVLGPWVLVKFLKRGVNTAFTRISHLKLNMPKKRGFVVADFVGHQDGRFRLWDLQNRTPYPIFTSGQVKHILSSLIRHLENTIYDFLLKRAFSECFGIHVSNTYVFSPLLKAYSVALYL